MVVVEGGERKMPCLYSVRKREVRKGEDSAGVTSLKELGKEIGLLSRIHSLFQTLSLAIIGLMESDESWQVAVRHFHLEGYITVPQPL